jgi:hypothetical protein
VEIKYPHIQIKVKNSVVLAVLGCGELNKNKRRKPMKLIKILILSLLLCSTVSGQITTVDGDTIVGWDLTFWELNDQFNDGLVIVQGDTISVEWDQPLVGSSPLQPFLGIGDTTGVKHVLELLTSDVSYAGTDTINVRYDDHIVSLTAGVWAATCQAIDIRGNKSQYSNAYWFIVRIGPDDPPLMPVRVLIRIVR